MKLNQKREMLRQLCTTDKSVHQIAVNIGCSWHTVKSHQVAIVENNWTWQTFKSLSDSQINALFNKKGTQTLKTRQPSWEIIHQLMQAKHQTLIQLHTEYAAVDSTDAMSYQQFTHHYRQYVKTVDICMRQTWLAGDVCFIDFAGKRIPWTDPETGAEHFAEIFVGVLGYSQLIFATALESQKLPHFIRGNMEMFSYFGGTTKSVVPDNLKSAVIQAGAFPVINRSYQEMAEHYQVVIEPARVRKPQDKSLAEIGVLLVTRWITVVLRRRKFFSVDEINQGIKPLLDQLNERPFKRYPGCRLSRFLDGEAGTLGPLPQRPFEFGHWNTGLKVNRDYHVYIENHAYSVPFRFVSKLVDVKITDKRIYFWYDRNLIATHLKSGLQGGATTDESHRPASHRAFARQYKEKFLEWAKDVGQSAVNVTEAQFENRPDYSVAGSKACQQLQRLASQYGKVRFERACACACNIGSKTFTSVRSILQCNIDLTDENTPLQQQLPLHHNVRGAEYYADGGQS